jgi:hypothetical protein
MGENDNHQLFCMLGFSNMPGVYQFEHAAYFFGFSSLHREASDFMREQLKAFYASYSEWFNTADYTDPEEMLTKEELHGLGERLQPEDIGAVFDALSEVLTCRLGVKSIESLEQAEELFNYIMDNGLAQYNDDHYREASAAAQITISQPESFGVFFVDHILNQIRIYESKGLYGRSTSGAVMAPFRSVVEGMKSVVVQKDWSKNDLVVGKLLMLIDIYQTFGQDQD